jgi:hypothetical protein
MKTDKNQYIPISMGPTEIVDFLVVMIDVSFLLLFALFSYALRAIRNGAIFYFVIMIAICTFFMQRLEYQYSSF